MVFFAEETRKSTPAQGTPSEQAVSKLSALLDAANPEWHYLATSIYQAKWRDAPFRDHTNHLDMFFDNPGNLYRLLNACPGRGTRPVSPDEFAQAVRSAELVNPPFLDTDETLYFNLTNKHVLDKNFTWETHTGHRSGWTNDESTWKDIEPLSQIADFTPLAVDMVYLNDLADTPDFGGAAITSRLGDVLAILEANDKMKVLAKTGVNPESRETWEQSAAQLSKVTSRYATYLKDSVGTFQTLQREHAEQVAIGDKDIDDRLNQDRGSRLLPEFTTLLDGIDPLDELEPSPRPVSISARNSGDSRTQGIQSR